MSLASGMIYVDPIPIENLADFYKDEYRVSYKNIFIPKPKHILRAGRLALSRLERSIEVIQRGARCLDIGAGGGEWVHLLDRFGCESFGIEPNTSYGTFAREHYGVEVFVGMYQDAGFERGSFDLLTLFHVLEHLADPVEDLCRLSDFLKPRGRFLIEVPNIMFPGMKFCNKWHEGHLFGFDALTLEAVAAKAGLRKVRLEIQGGTLFGDFEKTGQSCLPGPDLSGHFEAAKKELASARERYWRLPQTYTRVIPQLIGRFREKWISEQLGGPREILESVYAGIGVSMR